MMRAQYALALADGAWSVWTQYSKKVLSQLLARLPKVPAFCIDVNASDTDRSFPWYTDFDFVDDEGKSQCVWYAKGDSAPLLILARGRLVACVQRPWALSLAELEARVTKVVERRP